MRYGIIGRTAERTDLCDGQTIKTRVLVEELRQRNPDSSILVADTYNYKKRALQVFSGIVTVLKNSDVVFILLSRNGMRVIFPIVNSLNALFKKPILHDCIGGSLDELVERQPSLRRHLNCFSVNWVESEQLKSRLETLGVKNVEYLPNFKRLSCVPEDSLTSACPEQFRFCTFSRVNEAKGIGRACQAVIDINQKYGCVKAKLDIYGPIEENYDVVMDQFIRSANGAIAYYGVVPAEKSVETLAGAYALLFPTTFRGEGFPGTVIDAFSSGLPVIATDWHLNSEIIEHGRTGFLYSWKEPEKLEQWMRYAMEHPQEVQKMRLNCIEEVKKYDPDVVMEQVAAKIRECVDKEL